MLPRLAAEETLERAGATALGSGALKPAHSRRLIQALQRQGRAAGARATNAPPDPRRLAFMGIQVQEV